MTMALEVGRIGWFIIMWLCLLSRNILCLIHLGNTELFDNEFFSLISSRGERFAGTGTNIQISNLA
jgi:hypothetical protein